MMMEMARVKGPEAVREALQAIKDALSTGETFR